MNTLCEARRSTLIIIDLQQRLMPAIHQGGEVVRRAITLAQAARLLDIPVIGTTQNSEGLGRNLAEVETSCDRTIDKHYFDACMVPEFLAATEPPRDDLIVAGCEAHVCVLQTVLGLLRRQRRVRLVTDAIGSRCAHNKAAAIERARNAGAEILTTEMVLFEWLRTSDHPQFKTILELVKSGQMPSLEIPAAYAQLTQHG